MVGLGTAAKKSVGRHSRETALSEQLHGAPGHPVGGNNGGITGGKCTLHNECEDNLVPDMLNLVDEGRNNPTTQDSRHCGGDHGDTNFDWIIREGIQSDLRSKCDDSLPDHARNEQDDQVHGKLPEHGEQLEREDGVLRLGEVVPEAAHEDDGSDGDRGGHQGDGKVRVSEIRHPDEEDAEAGCEKGETDEVEFLEFLPSRFLEVMLGPRGWEIAHKCTGDTNHSVDDGNVKAPSPRRVDQQLGREVHAEATPWYVDAEFGPAETNTSVGCQYWYRCSYLRVHIPVFVGKQL